MIKVENFTMQLGDFSLRDINFEIRDGEIFAILGKTGAGKTILLESIAGFYEPVTGTVKYDEQDILEVPIQKRKIGFVYQDYGLFPHMKVAENIEFGLRMNGIKKEKRREMCLETVKLLEIEHLLERYPGTLSGGEKQRTALARALVLRPKVLFMDEPFSALDPNTRKRMYELIRKIHGEYQCTIIFVTHDFEEARSLAGRIGIVLAGRLREVCASEELYGAHEDAEVADFIGGYAPATK